MTKEFDKRNMAKSRRVCEDMEAAHVTKWLKLTERERQILAMWPRFEDGEYVWFGDIAKLPTHGAISVEAIEFTAGKVHVKDAEDGDWNTSMRATRPLKRPAQSAKALVGVVVDE